MVISNNNTAMADVTPDNKIYVFAELTLFLLISLLARKDKIIDPIITSTATINVSNKAIYAIYYP